MNILCILLPVLIGLICALLGYLLGRLSLKNTIDQLNNDLEACRKEREKQSVLINSLKADIDSWKDKFGTLQADFDTWKDKYATLQSDFNAYKLKFKSEVSTLIPFDGELAASVFRTRIKENDLKVVEGIGPKIEKLFHDAGIKTWKLLAETSVEKCQEILNNAGEQYRIHKPETWPKQCELAYLGKWNELKEWQDSMTGGKK
jgi:predicted flap endonuclease-1-like 5' DNA nuclease